MLGRLRTTPINQVRTLGVLKQLPSFEEALARLLFLVEHRRPCGIVLGQAGTGKSALIEIVREELTTPFCTPIVVDLQTCSAMSVTWTLAAGMGLSPTLQESAELLWRRMEDRLSGAMSAGISYVPLIDHLEHADETAAVVITRCCRLFAHRQSTVLLCGRSPVPAELFDVVRSLCDLRIELPLWSEEETARFVTHIQQVGHEPPCSGGAVAVLHHYAGGRLCDIQQLLGLTNYAAAAEGTERIDAELVESVAHEIWRPVTPVDDTPPQAPTILELAAFCQ